jgi:stringent starvation protein B
METSTKPYLIRAIHEWCSDNGYTPYLAVAVDERTQVPREFVRNGEIVLNVSSAATNRLSLGNDLISFQARFGGAPRELSIPVENVTAIYARENGHGMAFDVPKALALVEDDRGDGIASDGSDASHGYDSASDDGHVETQKGPRAVPTQVEGEGGGKARGARKGRKAPVLSLAPSAPQPSDEAQASPPADEAESTADRGETTTPDDPDPARPPAAGGRGKPRSGKPRLTRVK